MLLKIEMIVHKNFKSIIIQKLLLINHLKENQFISMFINSIKFQRIKMTQIKLFNLLDNLFLSMFIFILFLI